MLLAGSVDLVDLLTRLAASRPVFHSEADFQHAFCWTAQQSDERLRVRLETHPEPNVRLDALVSRSDLGAHTVIELKYLTRTWSGQVDGETFALKNQGAQDIRAYDVVKDVSRVERFVAGRSGWNGAVIALSNDPAYWRPVTHGRETNAQAFRLYDGNLLEGHRTWGSNTGAGTMRSRTDPLHLKGLYRLSWRNYAHLSGQNGTFRALVVEVWASESPAVFAAKCREHALASNGDA